MRFLFIRVSVFTLLLAAVAFILFGYDFIIPAGIITGGALSVYKVRLYSKFLNYSVQSGKNKFIKAFFTYLFFMVITFLVLVAAVKINAVFFYSITAGLLVIIAVIFINIFTEGIGLTHNKWHSKK